MHIDAGFHLAMSRNAGLHAASVTKLRPYEMERLFPSPDLGKSALPSAPSINSLPFEGSTISGVLDGEKTRRNFEYGFHPGDLTACASWTPASARDPHPLSSTPKNIKSSNRRAIDISRGSHRADTPLSTVDIKGRSVLAMSGSLPGNLRFGFMRDIDSSSFCGNESEDTPALAFEFPSIPTHGSLSFNFRTNNTWDHPNHSLNWISPPTPALALDRQRLLDHNHVTINSPTDGLGNRAPRLHPNDILRLDSGEDSVTSERMRFSLHNCTNFEGDRGVFCPLSFGLSIAQPTTIPSYEFMGTLGQGTYGKVLLGCRSDDSNSELRAIKVMPKRDIRRYGAREVVKELGALRLVSQTGLPLDGGGDNVDREKSGDWGGIQFLQHLVETFQDDGHVFIVLVRIPPFLRKFSPIQFYTTGIPSDNAEPSRGGLPFSSPRTRCPYWSLCVGLPAARPSHPTVTPTTRRGGSLSSTFGR